MTDPLDSFLSEDHRDLFQRLLEHEVEFVLIGGVAVVYHGYVRTTQDIDILYRPEEENVRRLFETLNAFFGGVQPDLGSYKSFLEEDRIFRFGHPPDRVEFMNSIDGVSFDEVWEHRETITIPNLNQKLPIIDLERLLKNKNASSRTKDQADFEELRKVHREN